MFFCCQQKNNFCHLRIKSGLFFKDLKFKSGLLNKKLSVYLKIDEVIQGYQQTAIR